MGLVWLVEALLLGWLLAWRWMPLNVTGPVAARWLLLAGAGAAGGIGIASIVFFLVGVLAGSPGAAMAVELALLAWSGWDAFRHRGPTEGGNGGAGGWPMAGLAAVALLVIAIATLAIAAGWEANPQGNWDAWSIWNLRARYLAAGDGLAARAWSPMLAASTHSEYPLLVSAFTARCWAYGGEMGWLVPAATSYVFFLALLAMAAGGVTLLRGGFAGAAAAMVLAATPSLVHEVAAQYADVPLACFLAGALVFALLQRPAVAGVLAGLAAWTKDEGWLFAVVLLAAMAVWRRGVVQAIAGAAPALLLAVAFKLVLARGSGSLLASSLPGAASRLADVGRYGTIAAAFGREFFQMGAGLYHPALPLVAIGIAFGFDQERLRDGKFAGAVVASVLAGYFGIYAITANDLTWQLQTSLARLLVQVWPLVVVTVLAGLRVPAAPVQVVEEARRQGKVRERRR